LRRSLRRGGLFETHSGSHWSTRSRAHDHALQLSAVATMYRARSRAHDHVHAYVHAHARARTRAWVIYIHIYEHAHVRARAYISLIARRVSRKPRPPSAYCFRCCWSGKTGSRLWCFFPFGGVSGCVSTCVRSVRRPREASLIVSLGTNARGFFVGGSVLSTG
jgi:hypothetical protein